MSRWILVDASVVLSFTMNFIVNLHDRKYSGIIKFYNLTEDIYDIRNMKSVLQDTFSVDL